MASTQSAADIWSSETFTASVTHADSAAQTINTGYGAGIAIDIINGGTGPTVPLGLQIKYSMDGTKYYDYGGPFIAGTASSTTYAFTAYIPMGLAQYWKVVPYQNNTGQNVTVNLDGNNVTAVA